MEAKRMVPDKLKKQEDFQGPRLVDNTTVTREELNLENKVYSDKVEEDDDRMAGLRHKIAGDVVMLSHLAMKLYYVKVRNVHQLQLHRTEINHVKVH